MEWALGKNKPFFVGQRSLAILKKRPLSAAWSVSPFRRGMPGRCRRSASW